MNAREKTLVCDTRVRFDEETDAEIRRIAAREGTTPAALVRKWALEGIRRDEAIRKDLKTRGLIFSLSRVKT